VPASMCRQIASFLLAVHGQHATQALLNEKQHVSLLDAFAKDDTELSAYRAAFSRVCDAKARLEKHLKNLSDAFKLEEIYRFRIKDIESVDPKPGEEEKLEEQKKRLSNAEKLEKIGSFVEKALINNDRGVSAADMLGRAADAVAKLEGTVDKAAELAEKLRDFQYEVTDVAEYIVRECSVDVDNPSALLDRIESRLDAIAKLRRKYGGSVESVLAAYDEAKNALEAAEDGEEKTGQLERELGAAESDLSAAAERLTAARKKAAEQIDGRVSEELAFLDMEKVRFRVNVSAGEYSSSGGDDVRFLISTNPGEPLMPLSKIASGGELSRIMLAMKCVFAESEQTSTLVYDEIDTGISGRTSHKIGQKLKQSASSGRVICVTHSPQIAALADRHILIEKEEKDGRAETSAKPIDGDGRIKEIARIIGGAKITEKTVAAAADMLNQAKGENK
ncbi:MAG: DNA repair protein RecN, partial [Clostridia bacterium]|nr:DNA repair protein RecN [Clostridia bacterium]